MESGSFVTPQYGKTIGFSLLPNNQTDEWQAFQAVIYNISRNKNEIKINIDENKTDTVVPLTFLLPINNKVNYGYQHFRYIIMRSEKSPKHFKIINYFGLVGNDSVCYTHKNYTQWLALILRRRAIAHEVNSET